MSTVCIGLLCALVSTNQPAVVSNRSNQAKEVTASVPNENDPIEKEYLKLLEDDDGAQTEVEKWIRDDEGFEKLGASVPKAALQRRIDQRFALVRKSYEDFLQRHPTHTRARLAYGSFLNDIREEEAAVVQWEKAKELDPNNPAAWNNLANHYGHRGPIENAYPR